MKHYERGSFYSSLWCYHYKKSYCGHKFSIKDAVDKLTKNTKEMTCKRCLSLLIKDAERGHSIPKAY